MLELDAGYWMLDAGSIFELRYSIFGFYLVLGSWISSLRLRSRKQLVLNLIIDQL